MIVRLDPSSPLPVLKRGLRPPPPFNAASTVTFCQLVQTQAPHHHPPTPPLMGPWEGGDLLAVI